MWARLNQAWQRNPVWYGSLSLDSPDITAAITVAAVGAPALIIGGEIATKAGLGLDQLVLAVPIGIVAGAVLMALVGRPAAATGTGGPWLFRPGFGSLPATVMALVRLVVTLTWGAIALKWAGDRLGAAAASFGPSIDARIPVFVIGLVALIGTLAGPSTVAQKVIRRWLYWATVVAVVVMAWRLLSLPLEESASPPTANFLLAFDLMVSFALILLPYATDVVPFARREEEAAQSVSFAFGVAGMLALVGGAILAHRLGGVPEDFLGLAVGGLGAALAIGWILAAHLDDGYTFTTPATSSLLAVVPWIPGWFLAAVASGGAVAGSLYLDMVLLRQVADIALIGYAAAIGVLLADFYLISDRYYQPDQMFKWRGYGFINPLGVVSWLLAVAFVLGLHPTGPDQVRIWLEGYTSRRVAGLPDVSVALVASFSVYAGLGIIVGRIRARTFPIRGLK